MAILWTSFVLVHRRPKSSFWPGQNGQVALLTAGPFPPPDVGDSYLVVTPLCQVENRRILHIPSTKRLDILEVAMQNLLVSKTKSIPPPAKLSYSCACQSPQCCPTSHKRKLSGSPYVTLFVGQRWNNNLTVDGFRGGEFVGSLALAGRPRDSFLGDQMA